jgi:hypothetical protein
MFEKTIFVKNLKKVKKYQRSRLKVKLHREIKKCKALTKPL